MLISVKLEKFSPQNLNSKLPRHHTQSHDVQVRPILMDKVEKLKFEFHHTQNIKIYI